MLLVVFHDNLKIVDCLNNFSQKFSDRQGLRDADWSDHGLDIRWVGFFERIKGQNYLLLLDFFDDFLGRVDLKHDFLVSLLDRLRNPDDPIYDIGLFLLVLEDRLYRLQHYLALLAYFHYL